MNWKTLSLALPLIALAARAADVPRPASEFVVKTTAGQQILLSQYRGKVVVMEFLLTTCPHCQNTTRVLNKLHKEFGARGFQPLGVAIEQDADKLLPGFLKEFSPNYPVGSCQRESVVPFLQHPVMQRMLMPQVVLVDRKGVIRAQYGGDDPFMANEEQNLRALILKHLSGPAGRKSPGKAKK